MEGNFGEMEIRGYISWKRNLGIEEMESGVVQVGLLVEGDGTVRGVHWGMHCRAANYHSHAAGLTEIKSVYSAPIFVLPTFKQFSFITEQRAPPICG